MMMRVRMKKHNLRFISVLISLLIWIYVVTTEKVQFEKVVQLEYILPEEMVFSRPPPRDVTFVLRGMRAFVPSVIKNDKKIVVDLSRTSSHNGHEYHIELELEKMVLGPSLIPLKVGEDLGSAKRLDEVIGRYIVHTKAALSPQYSLEGLRIVVDGANGAGYKLAPIVFEELGAEVISLGNTPNGTNINKGCGALYPQLCAENVKKYRADLGDVAGMVTALS